MPSMPLGKVAITPRGNFAIGTEYKKLDTVYDTATNASYMSIAENKNVAVTDTTKWMCMAKGVGDGTGGSDNNYTDVAKAKVDALPTSNAGTCGGLALFDNTVPNTRKIADLALSGDIALSQLIAKGLASGDARGNANNALSLGGTLASLYPTISSGTWTPKFYVGDTENAVSGIVAHWLKIGTHVDITLATGAASAITGTGNITIVDFPFASLFNDTCPVYINSSVPIFGRLEGTTMYFYKNGNITVTNSDISGFELVRLSLSYASQS